MTTPARAHLVSIVLPTRNRSSVLTRAIDSVRDQTHARWELIVVDDGSTDDTADLVRSIAAADSRISILLNAASVGAAAARNRGIAAARGDLIAFIDDDAEWLPRKLELQLAALAESPEAGLAYSRFLYRDDRGSYRLIGSADAAGDNAVAALLRSAFIDTSVILVRKELIEWIGGFDETLPRLQDWDLVLRLAHVTGFSFTADPLVVSYQSEGSISTRPAALIDACDRLDAKYGATLPRREHAAWLATLGHTLLISGAPHQGRSYLKRALTLDRRSRRTLLLGGLSLAGAGVYKAVADLRTAAIHSVRGTKAVPQRATVPTAIEGSRAGARTSADVDVIIVNWNGLRWLPGCLDALSRSTVPHRVILVDNASTDGSAEYVRCAHPHVTLLANGTNDGYAGGANRGLRASDASYALVMNPDVLLEPDHLRVLRDRLEQDPLIGVAQGKLYSITPVEFMEGIRSRSMLDSAGHMIRRSRMVVDRGQGEVDGPAYAREASIFSACGAAMFLRRSMLEDIAPDGEYFGESFFAYKEDVDLGWRARLLGWDVRFVPDAVAHHVRGLPFTSSSWRLMPASVRRHSWKNHYLLMIRNDRVIDIVRALPWIAAWEGARVGHALLRDPRVLTAYVALGHELRRAFQARRDLQRRRRAEPAAIRSWFGSSIGTLRADGRVPENAGR